MPQGTALINSVFMLLEAHRSVFGQERVYLRAVLLVLAEVLTYKGHRVTDLLRRVGLVEEDWSAWYRVFQQPQRFMEEWAGAVLLGLSLGYVEAREPYVIGIDTTQVPRESQKLQGSGWLKCIRTPPWKVGIHRAQRFLNGAWLTPLAAGFCRAIPLRFLACFPEKAVRKELAAQKEQETGLCFVAWVRQELTKHGRAHQPVLCLADGSYDKVDFWRGLPEGVTALVRTAKNRALHHVPGPYAGTGRRRVYGQPAPAPKDYAKCRQRWQTAQLPVRGRTRRVVYRVEGPFLRKGMPHVPVFLICVRGQTWKRSGKTQRREPVYYLVNAQLTDGQYRLPLPILTLLTWAWQRWELEVIHREVKSLFGLGDKQCHHPRAAVASVQWSAWVYALLTFAAFQTYGLPTPPRSSTAWYRHPKRWTFSSLLDDLRHALLTVPEFRPLFSASPTTWPKLEACLLDFSLALSSSLAQRS